MAMKMHFSVRVLTVMSYVLLALQAKGVEGSSVESLDLGKETKVSTINVDSDEGVWIGTDGEGLAYKESTDTPVRFRSKFTGNLPADVILCSYKDRQGRLWFGTFGDGMFYQKNGTFESFISNNPLIEKVRYCTAIVQDKDKDMWFGTGLDGIYVYNEATRDTFHLDKDNSNLLTNTITDMKSLDGKYIYISTGWGMYVVDKDRRNVVELKDNRGRAFLSKTWIRYLAFVGDELWIGTKQGVYIYKTDGKTYRKLTKEDGLGDNEVRCICCDLNGNVWIAHPHCVSVVKQNGEIAAINEDKLGKVEFHVRALACMSDGRILAGTKTGVLILSCSMMDEASSYTLLWIVAALLLLLATIILWQRRTRFVSTKKRTVKVKPIVPEPQLESVTDKTMERLTSLVMENLQDISYSVEQLSSDMGMSRASLYKKVTSSTGMSPLEYIRSIKVERGRQLLDKTDFNISQVAWQIGLSPKQFSKYFKERYNVLPSEYERKEKK